ncbi:hypothetical protein BD779DRAFT_1536920 [Infundibulicybe gibba]|nr:hypothetical protein BD779DRAFT_1536920 [Infundibulicybe gibba]
MHDTIPLLPATLTGVCFEGFLYGVFFLLFVVSIYLVLNRPDAQPHPRKRVRLAKFKKPMVISSFLIFITISLHWIFTIVRVFQAFVYNEPGVTALEFFNDPTPKTYTIWMISVFLTTLIGDSMMIYRLWVVWSYDKIVIIVPVCCYTAGTVSILGSIYHLTHFGPNPDVFATQYSTWIINDCVFTICINIYSSGFIAWRIWRMNLQSKKYGGSDLMSVVSIVVESALLYTVWTVWFFICYIIKTNLYIFLLTNQAVITGIVFMLINVRIGMGWNQKRDQAVSTFRISPRAEQGTDTIYNLHPMAVNITQTVDYRTTEDTDVASQNELEHKV